MTKQKSRGVHASLLFCASMKAFPFEGKVALRVREDPKRRMRCLKVFRVSATSSVSYADSCLAAAQSRRGSDMPPACHSLPRRRFATLKGKPFTASPLCLPQRGRRSLRLRRAICRSAARYTAPPSDIRLCRAIYAAMPRANQSATRGVTL